MSVILCLEASRIWCSISGLCPICTRHFGRSAVRCVSRVPFPPAMITNCMEALQGLDAELPVNLTYCPVDCLIGGESRLPTQYPDLLNRVSESGDISYPSPVPSGKAERSV